jgi:hypothetical protein
MSDTVDVKATIDQALQTASRCTAEETSENYERLDDVIEQIESQSNEAFKSKLDVASLLPKLKNAKPLPPEDLKTLELLIVGDAESYVKNETEVDEWRNEMKRILAEIDAMKSANLDVDGLLRLRALCREARRVVPDLVDYFDQKERTVRFQQATKGPIDAEGYRFLTQMVVSMLESDRM